MQNYFKGVEKRSTCSRRGHLSRRLGVDRRELSASWEAFNGLRSDTGMDKRTSSGRRLLEDRRLYERRM